MNPLKNILLQQIKRFGPLSISQYMALCLLHPDYGYYMGKISFGREGDFVTAPEVSQMFGELLGLCLAQSWCDQGSPQPFLLIEIGAGKGTLLYDMLRATKAISGFHQAMQIRLIEVSAQLRAEQKRLLTDYNITWSDTISDCPHIPIFLIANEFFDCLPIRQYQRTKTGWCEKMVGCKDQELQFYLAPASPFDSFPGIEYALADTIEINSAANAIIATLSCHIQTHGGVAIIIDYGRQGCVGNSLQAVQKHQKVSPLINPGQVDLSALVDFMALKNTAATYAQVSEIIAQGVILERLGITARARQLAKKLTKESLKNHIAAHRRLTHPEEMGSLFKALAIVPRGASFPYGFYNYGA